jgi:serine/threonine-protein kinase
LLESDGYDRSSSFPNYTHRGVSSRIFHPSISLETVSSNLNMELVAGNGPSISFSGDMGPATSAGVDASNPWVDSGGNIYFPDSSSFRIRRINAAGQIMTVAGTGSQGTSGIPTSGVGSSGSANSVNFYYPYAIVGDNLGIFIFRTCGLFGDLLY